MAQVTAMKARWHKLKQLGCTPQVWHARALIAQAHRHCAVLGENYLNAQRSAQSQQWQRCHTVSYNGIGRAFLETALLAVSPSFPAAARPLM